MSHIGRWTATGGGAISAAGTALAGHPVLAAVVSVLLVVAGYAGRIALRRLDPECIAAKAASETAKAVCEMAKQGKDVSGLVSLVDSLLGDGTKSRPSSSRRRTPAKSKPQASDVAPDQ